MRRNKMSELTKSSIRVFTSYLNTLHILIISKNTNIQVGVGNN